MSSRRLSGAKGFALWCLTLCCCVLMAGAARGDTVIQVEAGEDWTWEAGGSSGFQGSITADQDLSDAEITVSVETRLEDSGEIVFTSLDGERLKIRKRSDTVTADLTAGTEFPFEGEWYVPEDVDGGLAHAVITLRVKDSAGGEIAAGMLEVGDQAGESAQISLSPVKRADQLILILAIASGAVWLMAILRHVILNRKQA